MTRAQVSIASVRATARTMRTALPKLHKELSRPVNTASSFLRLTPSLLLSLRALTILLEGARAEKELKTPSTRNDRTEVLMESIDPQSGSSPLRNNSQEAFAIAVANGASGAEAYAHAYGRPRDATARANSCRLLADARVNARIQHLRAPIAKHGQGVLVKVLEALGADAERQIASGDLRACKRTVRRIVEIVEIAQGC